MKNKILINVVVPDIDEKYDLYIPINKKIGNVIGLLQKAIKELTNGIYEGTNKACLYNRLTGEKYAVNSIVRETNIRNGTILILL